MGVPAGLEMRERVGTDGLPMTILWDVACYDITMSESAALFSGNSHPLANIKSVHRRALRE
jgi:hypothetical protein